MKKNRSLRSIYIIILIILLLIGLFALFYLKDKIRIKEINNDIYYIKYDSTWNLKENSNDKIVFQNNDSFLTIKITTFDDECKYASISELYEEFVYNTKTQNPSYKLLASQKDTFTKNLASGYKILYENSNKQVMVWLYTELDKFVVATYESPNKYFDILLDSANNILYNFNLKDEKYNLTSEIDIKFSKVKYSTNKEIDKMLTEIKSYEIANNNYKVNYSIPSVFTLNSIDSSTGYFTMQKDYSFSKIDLNVKVVKKNIYEEIKYEYSTMEYYRNSKEGEQKDYKEFIDEIISDYDSYLYKVDYTYTKALDSNQNYFERQDEKIYLLYALDTSHTLVIEFESFGIPITKKMVDMVKINSAVNYSSNIQIVKEGNYLIGELKQFSNYEKNKIEFITLRLPERFEEIDKNYESINSYVRRYYGYNYDEKTLIYDYEVEYDLERSLSIDSYVNSYNSSYCKTTYGKANKVVLQGDITLNNKKFKIYSGGYTDIGGILFTNNNRNKFYKNVAILAYEMPNEGYLYIVINGNSKKISKNLLTELTNFSIEEKDY